MRAHLERLTTGLGWTVPEIRSERINLSRAPALYRRLMRGETVTLSMLLRSPVDRSVALHCEVLFLDRDDDDHLLMPAANTPIRAGDELLLAGTAVALNDFRLIVGNETQLKAKLPPNRLAAYLDQVRTALQGTGVQVSTAEPWHVWLSQPQLARQGARLVFVLGDPAYYTRHGFAAAAPYGLRAPYEIQPEEAWMVRALSGDAPGNSRGAVRCADALTPEKYWRE